MDIAISYLLGSNDATKSPSCYFVTLHLTLPRLWDIIIDLMEAAKAKSNSLACRFVHFVLEPVAMGCDFTPFYDDAACIGVWTSPLPVEDASTPSPTVE